MHEVAQLPWGVALAYLVAGVLFILALRGLSSPATSRAGNRYGMAGMAIARLPADHPDRRRRHAGRRLDAQLLFGLGGGGDGLHAGNTR
jgi:NAD/NADP transhydrogenase beta subunit